MRTYFNIWKCVNILIHSRHWMLNLIFKLLEIIAYVTSCFHICLETSEFKIPSRSYWSKIFHRKVARGNRWMAFESHSIFAYLRCASLESKGVGEWKRFLRGKGMVPQWSRLRKFLTLSPTPSSVISSTLPLMYLQRNKRKSRRAVVGVQWTLLVVPASDYVCKTFLKLGFNVFFIIAVIWE